MKESLLHYVWQYKLFPAEMKTTAGNGVEIIDIGRVNPNAGPDFFNAKIKMDGTVWVGNVEIHAKSSDWKKHRHTTDKAYDNVILHVVENADGEVFRTNNQPIPQIELKVPEKILNNYKELFGEKKWIYCEDKLQNIDKVLVRAWISSLLVQRLEQKMETIHQLLKTSGNNWEEAFYVSLARSFGFGVNSQPFEMLAKSLSQNILGKHKDNLFQIEAMLFGQGGFLEENMDDIYFQKLKKEYSFLRIKYNLTPVPVFQWKMLRLRPDNFPHIRLAQFAQLVFSSSKLFSKIIETSNLADVIKLFNSEVSDYWKEHYTFAKESAFSRKRLGKSSIEILLINTVVPFLFAYSVYKNEEQLRERALEFLEKIPAERNAVISKWNELGIKALSAYDSQALLQLKKKYCDEKNCLRCRFGHKILTMK